MTTDWQPGSLTPEGDTDPVLFVPASDMLDISFMQTTRLISPDDNRSLHARRQVAAAEHQRQATALRQQVNEGLLRYERSAGYVMQRVMLWLRLHSLLERTPQEEVQLVQLNAEVTGLERQLHRQWTDLSQMLHEAVNHDISARMLLARATDG